jgi:hypothetical protein
VIGVMQVSQSQLGSVGEPLAGALRPFPGQARGLGQAFNAFGMFTVLAQNICQVVQQDAAHRRALGARGVGKPAPQQIDGS